MDGLLCLRRLERVDHLLKPAAHGFLLLFQAFDRALGVAGFLLGPARGREIRFQLLVVLFERAQARQELLDPAFERVEDLAVVHEPPEFDGAGPGRQIPTPSFSRKAIASRSTSRLTSSCSRVRSAARNVSLRVVLMRPSGTPFPS